MSYAIRFPFIALAFCFTLMVMNHALPIVSEDSKESLDLDRSNWRQRRSNSDEIIDEKALIKRGVIQSIPESEFTMPRAYYFNKRRLNPFAYPIAAVSIKRDENHGFASINTKSLRIEKRQDGNETKTIPTANITPAAVNHTPPETNGRVAIDSNSPTEGKKDESEKSNTISLPKGVTSASQGFLFLPISKPNDGSSKSSVKSNESSSTPAHQTFFFNIASPDGGSVSKFEVNGDNGKPVASSVEKESKNNDASQNASVGGNSDPNKTRIIFKPLTDPDSSQTKSSSSSSSSPPSKPKTSNDDIHDDEQKSTSATNSQKADVGKGDNVKTSTEGASDAHADDKSLNEKESNSDEKAPTSSESTTGANEKKKDSDDQHSSNTSKENKQDQEGEQDKQSGKGKGEDGSHSNPSKNSDDGQQRSKGQGNGGSDGGDEGQKSKVENRQKKSNNDTSTSSKSTPSKSNESGKEDDYYLFPVEQPHKTVELDKGDMVAYVDHPQLAASKMAGNASNSSKRDLSRSGFRKMLKVRTDSFTTLARRTSNQINRQEPPRKREIIYTVTLNRRFADQNLQRREIKTVVSRDTLQKQKNQSFVIRSIAYAFSPFRNIFTRSNLQPGRTGVTPTYWHGQTLD